MPLSMCRSQEFGRGGRQPLRSPRLTLPLFKPLAPIAPCSAPRCLPRVVTQVIRAFDVDCCGFMYDGRAVRCTARAASAVAHRVNIAVPEKRSWTYESRLIKYAKRGYAIAVPGLDWSLVPEELGGPKLEQEEEAHVPDPPAGGRWSYVGGTLVENEEYKAWEKKWGEAYSEKQRKLHKRRFGGDDMYDYFEVRTPAARFANPARCMLSC